MIHNLGVGLERRRHPRILKRLPIKVRADLFDLSAETTNISSSGVYCQLGKYIEPMTKVNIVMLISLKQKNDKVVTKKIKCEGVVVRVEKSQANDARFNVAVFFSGITKANTSIISRYIESHQSENPTAKI